jgi:hypothetical protein
MMVAYFFALLLVLCAHTVWASVCVPNAADGTCKASRRLPLIAGNWKMNTDLQSATKLAANILELTRDVDASNVEIALFPPFPFIRDVGKVFDVLHYDR